MAAKQLIGFLEPYICGDNFNEYLDRVENYLELNNIEEEKYKILLLLNIIGAEACVKLNKACLPKKPKEMKFNEVVDICKALFSPATKTCTSAIKFGRRLQKEGETVHDFAIELLRLAEGCDFGNYKNKALRNQFITGLKERRMKIEMMSLDDKIEFKDVLQKAVAIEMIEKEVQNMEGGHSSREINRVHENSFKYSRGVENQNNWRRDSSRKRSASKGRNDRRCYTCQGMGHMARDCPSISRSTKIDAKDKIICYACQGIGHIARNCSAVPGKGFQRAERRDNDHIDFRRYQGKSPNRYEVRNDYRQNKIDSVDLFEPERRLSNHVSQDDLYFGNLCLGDVQKEDINTVRSDNCSNLGNKEIGMSVDDGKVGDGINSVTKNNLLSVSFAENIDVYIESTKCKMEVDTGACVSLCTWEDYVKYFPHLLLADISVPLSVLTGDKILVKGRISVRVKLCEEERPVLLDLTVVETPKVMKMLCGRDWLDVLFPDWRDLFKVNLIDECEVFRERIIPKVKSDYECVFDGDLSKPINDFEVNLHMVEDSVPIFHKAYA